MVRLEDVDDDPLDGKDGCTFLVGLMQKDGRRQKRLDRNLQTIGFAIYEVSENTVIFNMKSLFDFFFVIIDNFSKILCLSFYRSQIRSVFVKCLLKTEILAAKSTSYVLLDCTVNFWVAV